MAADYISVNKAKQLGNTLVRTADLIVEIRKNLDLLNDTGNHMWTGSDYTMLEANVGLASGVGQNTLNLIGLINTILNTSTDVTGANRLAQLDEFVSRLAGQ